MLKSFVRRWLVSRGRALNRIRHFDDNEYGALVVPETPGHAFPRPIGEDIVAFFDAVPPFYDETVSEPLRIAGAWGDDLRQRRKAQLAAIAARDVDAYLGLLDDMFRNGLLSGMAVRFSRDADYLSQLRRQFLEHMDGFAYVTGRPAAALVVPNYGNRWGFEVGDGILLASDPAQGTKAHNLALLLQSLHGAMDSRLTLLDLGSGFGSAVERAARWYDGRLTVILVDIPLNLTSAYAYVSACRPDAPRHLVTDGAALEAALADDSAPTVFVFVPTLLVEHLGRRRINVLHNHGSFSEMDMVTIKYYLDLLVTETTDFLIETNSNLAVENTARHTEVPSSRFPVPDSHRMISRGPIWRTPLGHRYLQTIYLNRAHLVVSDSDS
jgi:hypothetical protein